ncbi:MAG: PP2C family protein-serine/threonine phosphatase, partial [bacterium]
LDGMDMAFCAINDEELIYSGAHMSVALYKNNQLNILKGNKYSIGELPGNTGAKFEDYKENIEKGNILYLFSDGYQDQMGGINNNPIKMQNFYDLLREINHLPMKEQKEFLENYLEKWKKDNPQTDDILVAAIKF